MSVFFRVLLSHRSEFLLSGASLSISTNYHTPLHPITCNNATGWHHTTETFHRLHASLYILRTGTTDSVLNSWTLRMGQIGCPETSVRNYYYSLRNTPEERNSQLLHGGSLKLGEGRTVRNKRITRTTVEFGALIWDCSFRSNLQH